MPHGYSSNISRYIDMKQHKLSRLKSHDLYILIEQLLPLTLCDILLDKVTVVLVDFCSFLRQSCGKTSNPIELMKLQEQIVVTLCHIEMIFPPSFFTIMAHLIGHLVDEAKCERLVHHHWMYLTKSYNG